MNYNPPGSFVHGIFQARILEWFAIPPPGDLPDPGTKPKGFLCLLHWQLSSLPLAPPGSPLGLWAVWRPGVGRVRSTGCGCQFVWWCRNTLEGVDKGTELKRGIRQHEKERYSRQTGTCGSKHGGSWWLTSQVRTAMGAQDRREWALSEHVLRQKSHQKQNASSNTGQLKIIFVWSISNCPPSSPSLHVCFYDFLKLPVTVHGQYTFFGWFLCF